MSETWKYKHIDDWTCQELQSWIISIKLGSKNQKKVTSAIADQEISGEDFNSMTGKPDILDSFPDINAMSGNKIYAALKNIRTYKPKKKASNNKATTTTNKNKNKKKASTWQDKHINDWCSNELQDWICSIGLNPKDERKMKEAIQMQGIQGEDFNSMETASDVSDSFDGIDQNIGNKVFAELVKIRRMTRTNSNKKQYNQHIYDTANYNDDNDNSNAYMDNFADDNNQYSDTPYNFKAAHAANAKIASQYSDSPYNNNKNNKNNNNTYKTNQNNSLQYKINRVKQNYPELDDETIKDVLGRHNNNLQDTLKFIALKKRQLETDESEKKKQHDVEEIAHLFGSLISLAVVEEAGFVTAKPENRLEVIRRLTRVVPSGLTALRDAVVIGIAHMLKVKVALAKIGALSHKFVHIVLTDGEDTASEQSLNDLREFFHKLGRELGDLCTTYFIGVGLDEEEKEELEGISRIGGKSCELFNCDDVKIGDVFQRIAISLGIKQEIVAVQHQGVIVAAAHEELQVRIHEHKILVLFTLDISASMLDGRWDKVVAAVAGFMTGLKPHDIVGAILFNENCVIITDK